LTLERSLLRIPILKALLSASGASLFFATLAAALEAGIGPGAACRAACRASGLELLSTQGETLGRRLDGGAPFSAVLPASAVFSRRALEQVRLGEETGTLPAQMAAQAALEQEALSQAGTMLAVSLGVGFVSVVGLGLVVAIVSFWSSYFSQISALAM
jgi:type II secretory pathway component PulF